jgi:hypothetical protein
VPCMSDGYGSNCSETEQRLDEVTALLCLLCAACEGKKVALPPDVRAWWSRHKRADAARRRDEERQRQESRDRAAARAKLTARERRLLRLDD